MYLLPIKRGGTGSLSLFLYMTRGNAWGMVSCHSRGAGAFLPLGLLRLVAVEDGKEGWLQGHRAPGSPLQRGTVKHGWVGTKKPEVPVEAEWAPCEFKTRLRRSKGV